MNKLIISKYGVFSFGPNEINILYDESGQLDKPLDGLETKEEMIQIKDQFYNSSIYIHIYYKQTEHKHLLYHLDMNNNVEKIKEVKTKINNFLKDATKETLEL